MNSYSGLSVMELTDEQKQIVLDHPLGSILTVIQEHVANHYLVDEPTVEFVEQLLGLLAFVPLAAKYLEPTREQNPAYEGDLMPLRELLLDIYEWFGEEHLGLLPPLVLALAPHTLNLPGQKEYSEGDMWLQVFIFVREFYKAFYSPRPALRVDSPIKKNPKSHAPGTNLGDKTLCSELGTYTYREVTGFTSNFFSDPWTLHLYGGVVGSLKTSHSTGYERARLEAAKKKLDDIQQSLENARIVKKKILESGFLENFANLEETSDENVLSSFESINALFSGCRNYMWAAHTTEAYMCDRKRLVDFYFSKRFDGDVSGKSEPLVKRQKLEPTQRPEHLQKNVIAIGQQNRSNESNLTPTQQMASCARNVMAVQPYRRFIHTFTLTGKGLELWVAHHSGVWSGGTIDIGTEDGRKEFATALAGYACLDDETLGLSPLITQTVTGQDQVSFMDENGVVEVHSLSSSTRVNCSAFDRSTIVYNRGSDIVKLHWAEEGTEDLEARALKRLEEYAVEGTPRLQKYFGNLCTSWTFARGLRFKEASFNSSWIGTDSLPPGRPTSGSSESEPELLNYDSSYDSTDDSTDDVSDYDFGDYVSDDVLDSYPEHVMPQSESGLQEKVLCFPHRTLTATFITPVGTPLFKFRTLRPMLEAIADVVVVHWNCFEKGVFHRNITDLNIIIVEEDTAGQPAAESKQCGPNCSGANQPETQRRRTRGVLINFGSAKIGPPLAEMVPSCETFQKSLGHPPAEELSNVTANGNRQWTRQRSQSMRFATADVLDSETHTPLHDLQSFYLLLVYLFVEEAWRFAPELLSRMPGSKTLLSNWDSGTLEEMISAKVRILGVKGLKKFSTHFPRFLQEDRVLQPLHRLREIVTNEDAPMDGSMHAEIAGLVRQLAAALPNKRPFV